MRATGMMALGLMLAVLGTAGTATAEAPPPDFDREGLYLGAGAGYALDAWRNDKEIFDPNGTFQVNLILGYRISKWAALDIRIEYADDFLRDSAVDTKFGAITSTANVKAYPFAEMLNNRYQPYLTGGIGAMATLVGEKGVGNSLDGSAADWAFRVGGGGDIYITRNWAINIELAYVAPVADVADYNYASFGAGVMYRF